MTASNTSGELASLYPFLSASAPLGSDQELLAAARRSTADKMSEAAELRQRVLHDEASRLAYCGEALAKAFQGGATLFAFGNGGSSTDAASLVSAFVAPDDGRPLPAVALTSDVAVQSALANDIGFHAGIARHLAALARRGDIAVGLSTSGSSENLLEAFALARRAGLITVGFAGHDGGRMASEGLVDYLFVVPSSSVHRIQEAQTTLYHVLVQVTQAALGELARGDA